MTFKSAVASCLFNKYAVFQGRASWSEFWWFAAAILIYTLAATASCFVINFLTGGFATTSGLSKYGLLMLGVSMIGYVALLLPMISVTVRRFHDFNLSGWWVLAGFVLGTVPMVGWIAIVAILAVTLISGSDGENRFGPDPLQRI